MWKSWIVAVMASVIFAAGSAWYGHSRGVQSGMLQIQTLWDAERMAQQQAILEAQQKAQDTERRLQAQVAKLRKERANEKARIDAQYASLIDGLRDRPEARAGDTGVPEGARAGVGCTGAGLSKSDSEFLIWLSSEADRTQAALRSCVTAYEEVRRSINSE